MTKAHRIKGSGVLKRSARSEVDPRALKRLHHRIMCLPGRREDLALPCSLLAVRARLSVVGFRQGKAGDLPQEVDFVFARPEIVYVELAAGRHELPGRSIDRNSEADEISRLGLIGKRQT